MIENFKGKININFPKIIFIFNSIFYKGLKEYSFVVIFRKKLFFEPSLRRVVDTTGGGGTLINLIENFKRKKNINFQKTKLILNRVFLGLYIHLNKLKKRKKKAQGKEDN